jgi:stage III sporulation protein AF
MIAYVGEWIKHIVLIILIATFLDLLLPNTQMRRYIQLVVGLIIIIMILSPILEFLKVDHERMIKGIDELFQVPEVPHSSLEESKQHIEQLQDEAVLEEVERMWAQEIKQDLQEEFPLKVNEVSIHFDMVDRNPSVSQVKLVVTHQEKGEGRLEDSEPLVKPVIISIEPEESSFPSRSFEQKNWTDKVKTYFDHQWNISGDKIEILWTGG